MPSAIKFIRLLINNFCEWTCLQVMNDNFQVLSQAKDAGDILFAVYSNESREVITVGQSFATVGILLISLIFVI